MEDTATKTTVMKEETQTCPEALSHPPGYGWQPSLLYSQHFGLPPFLDFRDLSWMESIFRKLRTSSWPGYTQASVFTPQLSLKIHREVGGGVSAVSAQQSRWTVSLDVNHFAPSEIMVRTQCGFLEIEGKHDERQDEHGYISRCFLRKYKLPVGIEVETIHSYVTGDGVLTVEATLPSIAPPADVTIPVQVDIQALVLEDQKQDGRQPGASEIIDKVVVPSPAENPEGVTVDTDEKISHANGPPDAMESVEKGEEAITFQIDEEEKREEESVGVADPAAATEEVPDTKPKAPEVPEASEAPEITSENELETEEKKENEEAREAEKERVLLSPEVEGETQQEITSMLGVKGKQ